MEQMYQDYKDIAEFRMVYIKEAHASDGRSPVPYAAEKGITEHDDYDERCEAATALLDDESLTIPCIIDSMDDAVNKAYSAFPDRIYLVRTDGRLGVASNRGPWGFAPAIDLLKEWLVEFKRSGEEPALPDDAVDMTPVESAEEESAAAETLTYSDVVGTWIMETSMQGATVESTLVIDVEGDDLIGTWTTRNREAELQDVTLKGDTLSFTRRRSGREIKFTGRISDGEISGVFTAGSGERKISGKRVEKAQSPSLAAAVGAWAMVTEFQEQLIEATMTIRVEDGALVGTWESMGQEMELSNLKLDGDTLSFTRSMGAGGMELNFTGVIKGDAVTGVYSGSFGELKCTGERGG